MTVGSANGSGHLSTNFDLVDALSLGLAIADPAATILTSNAAFRRLLGVENGVTVDLSEWSLSGGEETGPRGTMLRADGSGRTGVAIHLFPLDGALAGGYLVTARDIRKLHATPERLNMLFDLAPREAEVAALLVEGRDLKTVARELGIATGTARAHLRGIFQKTGTHRQAALVACLASALAV